MKEVTEAILEKLNTLVVVVNQNGNVDYVSPAAKSILGFEPSHLIGDGWWNLTRTSESERIKIKDFVKSLVENPNEESVSYERSLNSVNGDRKWVLWNTSKGPDNTVIGIGQDITERKCQEEELKEKHKELAEKNYEIVQSISYAQRIQQAILPDVSDLQNSFTDAFVLYKPKDVVSGDLYWFYKTETSIYVAAIDCTGHGVPGAMMSVIANSLLREIIQKRKIESPAAILYALDEELFTALNRKDNGKATADGMDIALIKVELETNRLTFAGAFRPLILIREGVLEELKANRYPIGFYSDVQKTYEEEELQLLTNDCLYLFSDGYIDQFGGEVEKKFNKRRFKELLLSAQDMLMDEQEAYLDYAFKNWKQENEQTDDVVVIGIKV